MPKLEPILSADPVPVCTECGACCFTEQSDYIAVFEVDEARMSEQALSLTHLIDGKRYMRMRDGYCVALKIQSPSPRFTCRIYAERPDACRWLERGSGECQRQIATKGEQSLTTLRRKSDR